MIRPEDVGARNVGAGATVEDILAVAGATHQHAMFEGLSEEVNIIVGSDFGPECIGLCVSEDGERIVGVLPGTPAADYGLEACAKRAGMPIDYDAIADRIRKVQETLGGPFRLPDGSVRTRTLGGLL